MNSRLDQLQWEKLGLELEHLSVKDPNSMVPLILQIDQLLLNKVDEVSATSRKLDFLSFELKGQCENLLEEDRLFLLNEFFFNEKQFQLMSADKSSEDDLLLSQAINERRGTSLSMSLIYLHLASSLDLPVYLINLPNHCILKWVRSSDKCNYIDLTRAGKILKTEDLLKILNKKYNQNSTHKIKEDTEPFDIIPSKSIIQSYIDKLAYFYRYSMDHSKLKTVLDVKLKINCSDVSALSERVLLLKHLGYKDEALADLKRLLSFVDINQLSPELKLASYELKSPHQNPTNLVH